jgi:pantoate--beta-alanine ligase
MRRATTIAKVRAAVRAWQRAGERVVFVPTMGNLHEGHMSLIDAARAHGERFVASCFVNPMQFGPNEDFAHYPRTPERDEHMLRSAGCDLMFTPEVAQMYPNGMEHATRVEVPGLSDILCGQFRPGHFQGVTTVVAKLLHICAPDAAVFGEKDFQQLTLIRRMVSDLCMPVRIIAAPTVRAADGLAMSSRNQYLTDAERARAPALYRALRRAASRIAGGERGYENIERQGLRALELEGFRVDYFVIKRAEDLGPPTPASRHLVVLAAAHLGKARLIDNVQVTL